MPLTKTTPLRLALTLDQNPVINGFWLELPAKLAQAGRVYLQESTALTETRANLRTMLKIFCTRHIMNPLNPDNTNVSSKYNQLTYNLYLDESIKNGQCAHHSFLIHVANNAIQNFHYVSRMMTKEVCTSKKYVALNDIHGNL
jgi:hypothetical protein